VTEDASPPAEDVLAARREKLDRLRSRRIEPFALRFDRDTTIQEVRDKFGDLGPGESSGQTVKLAGRLMALRRHGRVWFGTTRDGTGELQLFLAEDTLGSDAFAGLEDLDLGDWVGAEGEVVTTKRGELSVRPSRLVLLTKSLRPMPEKWHGLKDVELRLRRRYLDLLANPEVRERVEARARMVGAFRTLLDARGFVEVETPLLQPIAGGTMARPFVTHHQALDIDMYLRVAPELYLKRLLVGGLERVYEIGRTFRNEGIGPKYNPEFTILEAYQAYASYEDMMELAEALIKASAEAVTGGLRFPFRGSEIDLATPWPRRTLHGLVSEALGTDVTPDTPFEDLRRLADEREVGHDPQWSQGKLVQELYEKLVEPRLIQPVIVKDFPREVSPLARPHRDDPRLTEHFDPVMGGMEVGTAFSELTDPDEQRARFDLQQAQRAAGAQETHPYDEDFVVALEHGMPPAGGLGLGTDRLLMILTDAPSLREVIVFPTLRPEA
jgi:lysyl-tRNA synthetase, class II